MSAENIGRRSAEWFTGGDETSLIHRAALRSGLPAGEPLGDRPVVAITASGSALNPCNAAMDDRIAAIVEGVAEAGGIPVTVPTMSLGEDLMKPSALLYRNLLSIEVEEYLRAYPIDGIVVTGICDKSLPGALMGALSADLPTIVHAGGSRPAPCLAGRELGTTDVWRLAHERSAGRLPDAEWAGLEDALASARGACNVMGTASTMALLIEALGLSLPGAAVAPAGSDDGVEAAGETGRQAVDLIRRDVRPSALLTRASFTAAAVVLAAIGGSTNAVIHLLALAGRAGIPFSLEDIRDAAARTPVIVDVEPVGSSLIAALHRDGGLPAVLGALGDLVPADAVAIDGRTLREVGTAAPVARGSVRVAGEPLVTGASIEVVRGSLAPDGAVIKRAAASPDLLVHTGPAVVFDDYADMRARIADPDLDVTADTVLVMRGAGPIGGPGMPEWGMIPIPPKLAAQGVRDMVRVSDARMSGTSFGTVVLHVAPEARVGGPLALVRDGDLIRLDVPARRLDLLVDDVELARRSAGHAGAPETTERGWPGLYRRHVLQADRGCDLDFLVPPPGERPHLVPPVVGRS